MQYSLLCELLNVVSFNEVSDALLLIQFFMFLDKTILNNSFNNRQLLKYQMDNFHLQITPVQVSYESKDPISLSCLFKKVVISTGHLLQKHQIKSSSQLSFGKANFQEGPTFAMSKEFQARNTKISLHFLAKKDRNISCIGSTEIYINTLPTQPYSLIELKLDNCSDPKAKLKLQIQRKQQHLKQVKKNNNAKPQKMGMLQTQGVKKQQFMINQRANQNIPTAYQISRRNYKNVEITNEERKTDKKSNSSKKSSYQQRHHVLNQANNKSNNTSLIKNQPKLTNNSPVPRRQTPQPIQINKLSKPNPTVKPSENGKYNISGKPKINSVETRQNRNVFINNQQTIQQPQKLKVKPYQQEDTQNYQTLNRNGFKSLEQQKKYKYKFITQKLQLIHDKIAHSKDRINTEEYSNNNSQYFQQNHRSCVQKSIPENRSQELHRVKSTVGQINSFNPSTDLKMQQTPKILNQSNDSNSQKGDNKVNQIQNVQKKFQNIKSVKAKQPQLSPASQKTVNIKNTEVKPSKSEQRKNTNYKIDDKQIEQAEILIYQNEIKRCKADLAKALKTISQKDYLIHQMQKDIDNYQETIQQKQTLLDKINQQYQSILQENFQLKQARPQSKRQESVVGQFRLTQTQSIKEDSKQNQEMVKMRKKMLQIQSQLKFKQNENKCLVLQIDNIKRQKRNLQQQVEILVSKDKNQITRKASIARIENITTSSLANNAKKENQILKNEVKILQQKLQSLNSLFESLIHPNDKGKTKIQPINNQYSDLEKKYKVLQQKCTIIEEQLKKKKNQLAEIINIIWKHQNGDLMNEVCALITQSQS